MKKLIIPMILSFVMIFAISGTVSTKAQAKSAARNNYWITGYGKGMGKKGNRLDVNYNGNKVTISGYGKVSPTFENLAKTTKLKTRTYKVSKKCTVGTCGREISYRKFLKENGRKGTLELLVDVHIKNNKVVYIDYGC